MFDWLRSSEPDFVDVTDPLRKRDLREAEFQAFADAGSTVQRVSGKTPVGPYRQIRPVMEYRKGHA